MRPNHLLCKCSGSATLPGIDRRRIHYAAFTLIEILVVVAIIALLVAILVPSLLQAREQATGVVCSSNMRAIMLGLHTYAAESRALPGTGDVFGFAFGGGVPSAAKNWKPGDSWLGLPYAGPPYTSAGPPPPWTNPTQQGLWDFVSTNAPRKGSLFRYVRNDKAYLCPKDVKGFPDSEDPKGGGGNGQFSYTMLGSLGFKPPEKCGSFTYVANFTQVKGAYTPIITIPAGTKYSWTLSKMIALIEEHPFNNTNHGRPEDSWDTDSYLAFRHHTDNNGGKGMFSFLDGHAEPRRYPYQVRQGTNIPAVFAKFQGLDLLNDLKVPYEYPGATGGAANNKAWMHNFPYPY